MAQASPSSLVFDGAIGIHNFLQHERGVGSKIIFNGRPTWHSWILRFKYNAGSCPHCSGSEGTRTCVAPPSMSDGQA
jgi:hypothetical protein